jgi:hypothetical protein
VLTSAGFGRVNPIETRCQNAVYTKFAELYFYEVG